MSDDKRNQLRLILAEGEGQKIEFKESLGKLDREIVAFANASGGAVYLGIDGDGKAVGVRSSNELKSRIQNIAANCDPPISISIRSYPEDVLQITVKEGTAKPHQCRGGFFLRNGPNCQKLSRDQIARIVLTTGAHYFDETINERFRYPKDFDRKKLTEYSQLAGIQLRTGAERILVSLDVAELQARNVRFRQAGVLFFAKDPQRFLKESHISCVRYKGVDRFDVLDRAEVLGDPITMIEDSLKFVRRNTSVKPVVTGDARHRELHEYPPVAVREAVINAVMHRDYYYDGSHIYIHIFSDRLEVESPGGLPSGLRVEDLGKHSVRRNRTIADLLYRAKYVERIGSGIQRMERALAENGSPPMEISATNFVAVRFYPRLDHEGVATLTGRQARLLRLIAGKGSMTKTEASGLLGVSGDTVLRDLESLIKAGVIERRGRGRGTIYASVSGDRTN